MLSAFRAVDTAISNEHILSRLAHVQLVRLFHSVETAVKSERQKGLVHGKPGYGNASIAIDIYQSAQHALSRRGQFLERRRAARRWAQLAGPYPLLLLIYSGATEAIVFVLSSY